jgi:hypothetical protein
MLNIVKPWVFISHEVKYHIEGIRIPFWFFAYHLKYHIEGVRIPF